MMTANEFKTWRRGKDWAQVDAARYLGSTQASVARWEKGTQRVPQIIEILATLYEKQSNVTMVDRYFRGMPKEGIVYIVQAEGTPRIKIGRSAEGDKRLRALRSACPYPIICLRMINTTDMIGLEASIHARYAAYRIHGEWFELPEEM